MNSIELLLIENEWGFVERPGKDGNPSIHGRRELTKNSLRVNRGAFPGSFYPISRRIIGFDGRDLGQAGFIREIMRIMSLEPGPENFFGHRF
jgi:hypothetical protein